jgi:hypothetical protein
MSLICGCEDCGEVRDCRERNGEYARAIGQSLWVCRECYDASEPDTGQMEWADLYPYPAVYPPTASPRATREAGNDCSAGLPVFNSDTACS